MIKVPKVGKRNKMQTYLMLMGIWAGRKRNAKKFEMKVFLFLSPPRLQNANLCGSNCSWGTQMTTEKENGFGKGGKGTKLCQTPV